MTELLIRNEELARLARKILSGLATDADYETAKLEDVIAIKSDTGAPHYKAMVDAVEKVDSPTGRLRKFVASQESRDRMGDVVELAGWDHTNFKKNAIALWAHQDRGLPLGTVPIIEMGQKDGLPTLWESIDYVTGNLNPMAEAVMGLVDAGVIKAVSVGFLPLKPPLYPKSTEERETMNVGPFGVRYTSHEQLELSCCTIPAHPAALASKMIRRALTQLVDEGKLQKDAAGALLEQIEAKRKKRASWWGYSFERGDDGELSVELDGEKVASTGDRKPPTEARATATGAGDDAHASTAGTFGDPSAVTVQIRTNVGGTGQPAEYQPHFRQMSPSECVAMAGLEAGDYRWDGKSITRIEAVTATLEAPEDKNLKAKIDSCLDEIAEVKEICGEITKALLNAIDEIAALQGVLRSSSRNEDPKKFYGEVFDRVKTAFATQQPQGGA